MAALRYHRDAMARLPSRRRPSPEETASLLAAVAPLVPEAARSRHIRRAVGVTRNVSTMVTAVPFVPLPARVAAGALTGVATVVDAALRPAGERPAVPSAPPPDEDEILHDPALFAADAASALATGALAAGHAIVAGARHPVLRRSVKIVAVAGVVISVGVVGYRLVVGPAIERRRRRRHDAMALIVLPEETPASAGPAGVEAEATRAVDEGARETAEAVSTQEPAGRGMADGGPEGVAGPQGGDPLAGAESVADGSGAAAPDAPPAPQVRRGRFGRRPGPAAPAASEAPEPGAGTPPADPAGG